MRLLRESDSLEKNNLTVQEWNKFYIELIVLYVHRKIAIFFDHSRLGLENKQTKEVKPKQKKLNLTRLHCLYLIRLIHSLSSHSAGETIEITGYPRNIILCNTRESSVAANLHVAFSV